MTTSPAPPELEITEDFARALQLLHSGSHLFLTGKAGTGKSTLIRHFTTRTTRRTVVAAPTGVAALNVNGYTLHRLFSWDPEVTAEAIAAGRYIPRRFAEVIGHLQTLIIDEASMIRADLFDCLATALYMYGPRRGMPFGGVQLVLVGDLYQLPPVVGPDLAEYFATTYQTPYFFSAKHFHRAHFPVIELHKVFRQVGDDELLTLLNAIRDGRMSQSVQAALNARVDANFDPPDDEFWLTLAPSNRIVQARNNHRLAALPGPEFVSVANARGELDGYRALAPQELRFKIGAQVMMLTNDEANRWVNGSLGTITEIEVGTDPFPTVWVDMRNGSLVEVGPHTWDITRPQLSAGAIIHERVGSYTQLPFTLAWAITIHKAQGQTLQRAVIDLTGAAFATGQLYVALSRCVSLSGMVLRRPITARDVKVDHRVRRFLRQATDQVAADAGAPGGTGAAPGGAGAAPGGTDTASAAYAVALEALLVGHGDGHIRPLEIATVSPDGTLTASLLNPRRDIGDAGQRLGITADDLQVAPSLAQAWPVFEKIIAGHRLVSSLGPDLARIMDAELKRTGKVSALYDIALLSEDGGEGGDGGGTGGGTARLSAGPAGSEGSGGRSPSPSHSASGHPASGTHSHDSSAHRFTRSGWYQALSPDSPAMRQAHAESAAENAQRTAQLSARAAPAKHGEHYQVLDEPECGFILSRTGQISVLGDARQVARQLSENLAGQLVSARGEEIICRFESEYGVRVERASAALRPEIDEVMTAGAGICFTGTIYEDGRAWGYEDLAELAERCQLRPAPKLAKRHCQVLIAASLASQSGKMRAARRWEIPIFSASEFLDWARAELGL